MKQKLSLWILSCMFALFIVNAHAQTRTWDPDSANNFWGVAGNWAEGSIPDATTTVIFNNDTGGTTPDFMVDLRTDRTVLGVQLGGDRGFTFGESDDTLNLGSGGITTFSPSSGSVEHVFNNLINLTANSPWNIADSAALTINGAISGTGSLTKTGSGLLTLEGTNTYTGGTIISAGTLDLGSSGSITGSITNNGNLSFNRNVVGIDFSDTLANDISGTGTLTKNGAKALILTGANTFTGLTFLNQGNLQIGNGGTGGSLTGDVQAASGTSLAFNRSDAYTYGGVISGDLSLSMVGTGKVTLTGDHTFIGNTTLFNGSLQLGNGSTTGSLSGNVSIVNNSLTLDFNRSDAVTYGGIISGSGGVIQSGTGTTVFSNDHTYSGGTTIANGTLQIGAGGTTGSITGDITNDGTLTFNRSDNISYSGVISGTGDLVKSGTGTLALSSANTYSGDTTIQNGVLQIGNSLSLQNSTVSIDLNDGLDVNGFDATLGALAGSGNLNIGSTALTIGNNTENSTYSGTISGTGSLTVTGTGATLSGANTYSGGTTVSLGTLQIGNGGTTGSISGNVHNLSELAFNRSDDLIYSGTITGGEILRKSGAGTLTLTGVNHDIRVLLLNGGGVVLDGASGVLETLDVGNNRPLTIQNTTDDLDIDTLSNNGSTLITGASTVVEVDDSIQNTKGLTIEAGASVTTATFEQTNNDTTIVDQATLTLGRFSGTSSLSLGTIAISDPVGGIALTIGNSNNSRYSGIIEDHTSGPGSVFKTGSRKITLWGHNTYSGSTIIQEGTLEIAPARINTLANSAVTINSGATLLIDDGVAFDTYQIGSLSGGGVLTNGDRGKTNVGGNNTSTTFSGRITSGGLIKSGSGTLTLTGTNTYGGGTTINGGTLQIGDGGTTGSITGDVTNNSSLAFNRSDDLTYSNIISGTGVLQKLGDNTLTLTGTNTYSGGTLVSAGRLVTNSANALGSGNILLDGGTLDTGGQSLNNTVSFGTSGGSITGTGTINADLALNDTNQTLAPGNSPGIQNLGVDQTWSAFTYEWEIDNWLGTVAGDDYDQIQIDGELTLTGTTSGSYLLDILSLTGSNFPGDVPNFLEQDQSWLILTTTTGILGFDAAFWDLDTSGFTSDPSSQGTFTLSQNGNNLQLDYEAIPEPSTVLLLLLAGGLLFVLRRGNFE